MEPLDRILQAARSHPFYRDALRSVGRFEDVPVLEKPALYERIQEAMRDAAFRQGIYLSPSGGTTTGRSLYFPTAIQENKQQRVLLARRLAAAGVLRSTSIVLNLFPCLWLVRSEEIFNEFCELCGATVLPVSAHATDEEAWTIADQFGATMVAGMPSRLLAFARWMAAQGRTLSIESVLFGGELLHPQKRRMLERVLGVRRFSGVYGSAEMGIVAYQADVGEPPVYRFPREILHVEIWTPDGEGFGRLVATNLVRTRHPLLRYNTGDVGRVVDRAVDEVCVELRGRQSDSFSVNDSYSHLRDFAPVLDRFAQYQIVIAYDEQAAMDRITFKLAAAEPAPEARGQLVATVRELVRAEDESFITEVVFVSPESLYRVPGTLKVPPVLDLRGRASQRAQSRELGNVR